MSSDVRLADGASHRRIRRKRNAPIEKVIFVSYGEFDCNSAGHIAGFANALVEMGYRVGVCAGKVQSVHAFGEPKFEFFDIAGLLADPRAILGFDGVFDPDRTLILCWTPREVVRKAVEPIAERYAIPYVVHFEDNELHLAEMWTRKQEEESRQAVRAAGLRGFARRKPAPSIPSFLSDPQWLGAFLGGAAAATIIEERLGELLPTEMPALVLEPGVDHEQFGRPLDGLRRSTIRRALGIPGSAAMVVYPGNVHWANIDDMRELYRAIGLLRRRAREVVLVRTGRDAVPDSDFLDATGPAGGVINLGYVDRPFLIDLMRSADLFIQPGRPGPFNDYRLPSKVPEFMAVGRPIVLPATNVGNRLTHGVDAMLLKDGSAEEIAGHVEAILDDAPLAGRLAANAQAFARRTYVWDRQAQKLAAFLQQVVRAEP